MKRRDVRKGQVVLSKTDEPPKVYREFVAEGKAGSDSLLGHYS